MMTMTDDSLKGKTVVVTAGHRGMGEVVALRYAASGANIVIIANKDLTVVTPINTNEVAEKIIATGGNALTLEINVADVDAIETAVNAIISRFNGIDILINNLSTLNFKSTSDTTPEEFDNVITTNIRATFFISKACFPHLKNAANPHIINIAPPLDMGPAQDACKHHLLFSISKYGMSMCTLGMAQEFRQHSIAVNSLWPATFVATATLQNNFQSEVYRKSRWSEIMADAAYIISSRPSKEFTGHFCIDEDILRANGVSDFTKYAVDPSVTLLKDIFLPGADYDLLLALNIAAPPQYKTQETSLI
jgi:citronellol/citronellal dehydrogenase